MDPFSNSNDGGSGEISFHIPTPEETGRTIPDGEYLAKVISVEQQTSQAGNPMLVFDFTLVEGDYAGRQFRTYVALTQAAMFKVEEMVNALGIKGNPGSDVTISVADVINTLAVLHIEKQEYNGETRSQIKRMAAPPAGAGTKHEGQAPGTPF
jgi:hypothetical protein